MVSVCVLLASASSLSGQIVASVPHCGSAAADLCVDLSDESVWVADQLSGNLCHYQVVALPAALNLVGQVPHPFGPAGFPSFVPRVAGVAYEPGSDSLFVLNGSDSTVQQIDKLGNAIGSLIPLTTAGPDSTLFGLSYDNSTSTLWTLDVNAEELLEYDLSGALLSTRPVPGAAVPGVIPGELSFVTGVSAGGGEVEVGYGNTLDFRVSRSIQLGASGTTGVEVDLSVIVGDIQGIARGSSSTAMFVCTPTEIYQVDAQQPALLPPRFASCFASPNGSVSLSWVNADSYQGISILRDGVLVTVVVGSATSYTDLGVPNSQGTEYTLRAFTVTEASETTCSVTTGPGGRIDYVPFAGGSVFGLTYDPSSDRLYATDSQSSSGRVYVYDASSMVVVDQFDTGLSSAQGIAFDTVQQRLVISNDSNTLISIADPNTGTVTSSFPIPTIGRASNLGFDADANAFYYVDTMTSEFVVIDADPAGPLISSCAPPLTSGVEFAGEVADLDNGSVLLSIRSVANGQLAGLERYDTDTGVCFESLGGAAVGLVDIGNSLFEPNGVTGIAKVGAQVYVASGASNTIFRLILDDTATVFIRGDVDLDADIDIADVVRLASALYTAGAPPLDCEDAADTNDDGILDISDPVFSIFYQFLSGPAPPGPFPDPGVDPTADLLGC